MQLGAQQALHAAMTSRHHTVTYILANVLLLPLTACIMEVCLSALASLEAGFSLAPSDSEGATALWEAACCCYDAIENLEPAPDQEKLLRLVLLWSWRVKAS